MANMEKKKYPIGAEFYELYEEVGHGVSAHVRRALCVPLNEIVAVKILDFERDNSDLNNICREVQTMVLVDHPNVLRSYCSFVNKQNLWVVMPFMAGGSCLHILKATHPDGFNEVVIATILREVLKGLDYLHAQGHIHRDVKAGNILIDTKGGIKLGDFGVSACLFDSGDRQRTRNTFTGTPCWMAPEVMEQLHGYDVKADIWSFGITALELAHGHAPFSKYPPMKVLLMTLQNAPPGLDYERDKKFSKSFKQMIASCLVKDPTKRPSAKKLLKHSCFKKARSIDYISRTLLEGLPTLGDRIKALKRKEEDMLAQKKMPDGQKEEISQSEYIRGISGWHFDVEDMKAQASLIQDVDDTISDNLGGSTNSLCSLNGHGKQLQSQPPLDMEDYDMLQNQQVHLPSVNLTPKYDKPADDPRIAGCVSKTLSPCDNGLSENNLAEKPVAENTGSSLEGMDVNSQQKGGSPGRTLLPEAGVPLHRAESDKIKTQQQNIPNCNGTTVPFAGEVVLPEGPSGASKSSENSDELEEKPKVAVQQKGRFKVTSEDVNLQKVITQHRKSTSLAALPLPSDVVQSSLSGLSFYTLLHSLLQNNIIQRDNILYMMKQLGSLELPAIHSSDGAQVVPTEKSELEAAHEREKDLLQELTDLHRRLISIQDEFQKLKMDNAPV